MKLITTLLFSLLITASAFAQDYKYEMSEPMDVSLAGWNKVLLMQNGNTIFFHFENRKGIIVKVYNNEHKEIATEKLVTKILDINILDRSVFKELIDIDGNAVLFVTQEIGNKETLVRIVFDGNTAKILKEEKLVTSASFQKRTTTQVLHTRGKNEYFVVTSESNAGFVEKKIEIRGYNAKHNLVKTTPLMLDQKGYDNITFRNACLDKNGGVLVGVEMSKIVQYPNLMENILFLGYLSAGSDSLKYTTVEIPNAFDSYKIILTHNPFAKSLNVLLSANIGGYVNNGLRKEAVTIGYQSLILINDDISAKMIVSMENRKARNYVYTALDTSVDFHGNVISSYTNKYGLSTIINLGYVENKKTLGRVGIGDKKVIGITQYNDKGEEIWGTVIPRQRIKSFETPYPEVFKKNSIDEINYTDGFNTKNNIYILFNELDKHKNLTLASASDSLYNHSEANPVCYKIGRKKEITKSYLFGSPSGNEYYQVYIGSADINDETGQYAAVVLHRRGGDLKTEIAWVQFEP